MFERKWQVQSLIMYIHAFSSDSLVAALWLESCTAKRLPQDKTSCTIHQSSQSVCPQEPHALFSHLGEGFPCSSSVSRAETLWNGATLQGMPNSQPGRVHCAHTWGSEPITHQQPQKPFQTLSVQSRRWRPLACPDSLQAPAHTLQFFGTRQHYSTWQNSQC